MLTSLVPTFWRQRHSFFVLATLFSSTRDVYHANLDIVALSRAGKVDAARKLFDEMATKDVVTGNSMLSAYWQNGLLQRSKALFHSMPLRNVVSWNSIIAACVQNDNLQDGFRYFAAESYNAVIRTSCRTPRWWMDTRGWREGLGARGRCSKRCLEGTRCRGL